MLSWRSKNQKNSVMKHITTLIAIVVIIDEKKQLGLYEK